MRIWISLFLGFVVGAILFLSVFYFAPMSKAQTLSPLAVVDTQRYEYSYSLNSSDALIFTNNGNSRIRPNPLKVQEFWEPAIEHTQALVTVLHNANNQPVGLGVKFSSGSEQSRLLSGEILVNSAWHIYTTNAGSAFIEQTENQWSYLMGVVIPARVDSLKSFGGDGDWQGVWFGNITDGPNALGTARVIGATGALKGNPAEAVEFIYAADYSDATGPVAETATMTIALTPEMDSD